MSDAIAGTPFEVMNLLASLVGKRIVTVSAYIDEALELEYPGRFGGTSPGVELDSGEVLRFELWSSLGAICPTLERDANGVTHGDPYDEDRYRRVTASDPRDGDPLIAQFENTTIEAVEVLVLETTRSAVRWELFHERGVVFRCSNGRELVFAVGLDREDTAADLPGVLLLSDIAEAHWPDLCRLRVG